MRHPTFARMGGKARIRKQIISLLPKRGNRYIEPFVGAGNLFFLAKKELQFKYWILNDPYCKLLKNIKLVDIDKLPEVINKEVFLEMKRRAQEDDDPIAHCLEPRITFGGKGWSGGFSGIYDAQGNHVIYRKHLYSKLLTDAKGYLDESVYLLDLDYISLIKAFDDLSDDDLIVIDPPYYNTKASYPNIDHLQLCQIVNNLSYTNGVKWAICGYDNEIYQKELNFKNRFEIRRNSEIKSSNTRKAEPVTEILWVNY